MMAIRFGDDHSLEGVIRRFLEDDEGGGPLGMIGDMRIISAVGERVGVDGDAIS
jgi:hypothetical protein